ncbi:hypothetical protein F4813DRAFT_147127 [Daldinia decipiens]|uniref:uncharacterized protein n=1 Tax=Daldinia decipiens TaxID=326647 RepID=UPI0020C414D3|nr:uncharacterized protein F4813DRAFT_147127 [Daldinia decipiens]KAI1655861.1 hypothetical protein F4813DRAFT_147127 [Daldinia decipiens]
MAIIKGSLCSSLHSAINAFNEIQGRSNIAIDNGSFPGQIVVNNEVAYDEKRNINVRGPGSQSLLESATADGSTSTTPSYSYESSLDLDRPDCRSTPRTPVSEILTHPNGEDVGPEKHVTESKQVQDSLLFDLSICNEVLLGRDVRAQHSAAIQIENNAIDLDKVNAEPSQQINHSPKQLDDVLKNVPSPTSPTSPTREAGSFSYPCITESAFITSIRLHRGKRDDTIYRWKQKSEITFNVDRHSFRSNIEYARMANETLDAAVEKWNKGRFGVRFKRVEDHEEAVFQLIYSAGGGDVLATAFFPNTASIGRRLVVYEQAFIEVNDQYDLMTNLFCHELGHILGLRHERAQEKETSYPSVQWGDSNPLSIMNDDLTLDEFCIHEKDYIQVKEFYKACATYNKYTIVDMDAKPYALYRCRCLHCRSV